VNSPAGGVVALRTIRKYLRFCAVGGSGMVVDTLMLYVLTERLELNLTVSKAIAAELALINNFMWNDAWTFHQPVGDGGAVWWMRLGKFNLICLTGIGFSIVLVEVLVRSLSLGLVLSNLVAIVVVSLWNFSLNIRCNYRSIPHS
jgi:dolichol-phosphate mannosyltransferase